MLRTIENSKRTVIKNNIYVDQDYNELQSQKDSVKFIEAFYQVIDAI